MAPAKPPVPTPWNLPFHDAPSGIHTSKLMWESGVGVATAATRQKAGTASGLAFGGAGGVNAPAGTLAAEAMVRSRRRSAPSAEHAVRPQELDSSMPARSSRQATTASGHPHTPRERNLPAISASSPHLDGSAA